ncbi:MAG: M23 family metallopeptidase [Leptospirales bacterium]|nr:M23 family metallopeptidase [Leptospirales bacterium]
MDRSRKGSPKRIRIILLAAAAALCMRVYVWPGPMDIPVLGARPRHWTAQNWWDRCPWCSGERLHYGLDIIRPAGARIVSATHGIVLYTGPDPITGRGGQVVMVLGADLLLHYYAHLSKFQTGSGALVKRGEELGLVGNTGASDLPHLHYSIFSIFPHLERLDLSRRRGWLLIFFLDPNRELMRRVDPEALSAP